MMWDSILWDFVLWDLVCPIILSCGILSVGFCPNTVPCDVVFTKRQYNMWAHKLLSRGAGITPPLDHIVQLVAVL